MQLQAPSMAPHEAPLGLVLSCWQTDLGGEPLHFLPAHLATQVLPMGWPGLQDMAKLAALGRIGLSLHTA